MDEDDFSIQYLGKADACVLSVEASRQYIKAARLTLIHKTTLL